MKSHINYKGRIIGLLIVFFITTNAFLILYDEGERVDRKSYINEWSQSFAYDLYEKKDTKGVFTSEETEPVFFNDHAGTFREFLVSEGDPVNEGDVLYSYNVANYYQQEAELQSEINRIEGEIDAIEELIGEVESYRIPDPPESEKDTNQNFFGGSNEPTNNNDEDSPLPSYVETEYMKEEKLAEQKAELAKQEAMLGMVEDQLDQLQNDGDQITVTSAFSGTVTDISEDLEAPLLTLQSTGLILEGKLHEKDRSQLEEGMAVEVDVPEVDYEGTGTLASLDEFPEEINVNRSSRYPFSVTLDEPGEALLPGYHADIRVITDEAIDVVTALDMALETDENLYAWIMNDEGGLERRDIETGIEEAELVEIVQGMEVGEWLAVEPKDEFRNGATFFTPLKVDELEILQMFKMDQKSMLTYGLLGILSR